ncbi:MAG: hypothetical protein K8I02_13125, partial [Candidatus Methylomirabilis sp.]|nr:hypothetical protein [Deltaproteobacteria bacterium]
QTSPFLATFDGALQPVLFDAADFDEGTDALAEPKVPGFADLSPPQPPLRPRVLSKRPGEADSAAAGVSGMSLPYILPKGMHAFIVRSPYKTFDIETFMINQIGWYFLTGGKEIVDDPCLADDSCPFLFNRAPE